MAKASVMIVDDEDVALIRQALTHGLYALGEIERIRDVCAIQKALGTPVAEELRPVHPTGQCESTNFARALMMLEYA